MNAVVRAAVKRCADVVQMAYNFFVARDLHQLTDELTATETAVMARSVLAHGLLAGHWTSSKMFFDHDHRRDRWTPEGLEYRMGQLAAIRRLVGGDVITMRAAAVRFVLSNNIITSCVLGPRSVTQLRQLVYEAGDGPPYFDDEMLVLVPELLESVGLAI